MKNQLLRLLKIALPCLLLQSTAQAFQIYKTGSSVDVRATTKPMTCLGGGGDDDLWSEGWRAMLFNAQGGDVVIIRADGRRGEYEEWLFNDPNKHAFPKINSVSTLILDKDGDGNQPQVAELIENAEMIFFAGGDQAKYLRLITGTQLERALNQALHERKIPFGGTSAGMAILGDVDFAARYDSPSDPEGTVNAQDILKDPTGQFVDLDRGFITAAFLNGVITDTHFSQRDRQGRLVGFMARAVYNNYGDIEAMNIRGIGADEDTAVCYGQSGQARVFGANSAYFVGGNAPIERIQTGSSLHWLNQRRAVKVYSIHGSSKSSARFDLKSWSGSGGRSSYWYVDGSDAAKPGFGSFEEAP